MFSLKPTRLSRIHPRDQTWPKGVVETSLLWSCHSYYENPPGLGRIMAPHMLDISQCAMVRLFSQYFG